MDPIHVVLLGAIQALTEFLPVSSSGHLILLPALLGWEESALAFDVALHVGTTLALLLAFWRQWVLLVKVMWEGISNPGARQKVEWRLGWFLLLGSVPAGLVGTLFVEPIEHVFRSPVPVALLLIIFGILLFVADHLGHRNRRITDLSWKDALVIGGAQALALAPGVSRSGVTLTAALLLGLDRPASVRFSFLLATPLIVAAGALELGQVAQQGLSPADATAFIMGAATSLVVGLLVIWGLLRYVQHHSFTVFVVYRIMVGVVLLIHLNLR